jgi:HK97 gp10 family phage protein
VPADVGISVENLAELRRILRKAEDVDRLGEFRRVLKDAAETVAGEARERVPVRSGRARKSIRAGVSGAKAVVIGGKKSVPYYGWLDFGSRTPVTGNPRSVGPWKGSGAGPSEGRFIYPAISEKRGQVVRELEQKMKHVLKGAGL